MGDLFGLWRNRVDVNGQRAVDVYSRELPEYGKVASDSRARAAMLDFNVFLRHRTVALAAENGSFAEHDLAFMESVGQERAVNGMSLASQRNILVLHTSLTLREVDEASGPNDIEDVMHTLAWLAPAGGAAQGAYTRGYLEGQKRVLPVVNRVCLLATALLADDPVAPDLAASLAIGLPESCLVAVVRIPEGSSAPGAEQREEVVEALLRYCRVPMAWDEPEEFVALVPEDSATEDRALRLVRDFSEMIGRPCSVGTASGRVGELAEPFALARQVSRVAPIEKVPLAMRGVADVFVELGVEQMPQVDHWLREVAQRLSDGPDLVATLDAYYRNDMNRLHTAASLRIHPRTLDYRLRRVQELTDLDPGSVRGVRILSTVTARVLAGAWT